MSGFMGNMAAHWWVILIIVVLVFGATRLPQLAKGVGESITIFRREVRDRPEDATEDADTTRR